MELTLEHALYHNWCVTERGGQFETLNERIFVIDIDGHVLRLQTITGLSDAGEPDLLNHRIQFVFGPNKRAVCNW